MADIALIVGWVLVPMIAVVATVLLFGTSGGIDQSEAKWIANVDHDDFQQLDDERPAPAARLFRVSDIAEDRPTDSARGSLLVSDVVDGEEIPEGSAALGRPVYRNDLTVVVGIGPKIATLCEEFGIRTWRELAHTSVPDLRRMLDAAGRPYHGHRPDGWPVQARLLDEGRWFDLIDHVTDMVSVTESA